MEECNANLSNQLFEFTDLGTGYYTIQVVHSGLCLDITPNNILNGTPLVQNNCNAQNSQQFRLKEIRNSLAIYTNTGKSNKVIDSRGNGLVIQRVFKSSEDTQRWMIE